MSFTKEAQIYELLLADAREALAQEKTASRGGFLKKLMGKADDAVDAAASAGPTRWNNADAVDALPLPPKPPKVQKAAPAAPDFSNEIKALGDLGIDEATLRRSGMSPREMLSTMSGQYDEALAGGASQLKAREQAMFNMRQRAMRRGDDGLGEQFGILGDLRQPAPPPIPAAKAAPEAAEAAVDVAEEVAPEAAGGLSRGMRRGLTGLGVGGAAGGGMMYADSRARAQEQAKAKKQRNLAFGAGMAAGTLAPGVVGGLRNSLGGGR